MGNPPLISEQLIRKGHASLPSWARKLYSKHVIRTVCYPHSEKQSRLGVLSGAYISSVIAGMRTMPSLHGLHTQLPRPETRPTSPSNPTAEHVRVGRGEHLTISCVPIIKSLGP